MSRVLNAGHNGGVTENTFFHHLKVLDDLDRQKASVMSKIKNAKAAAKDDGVNLKVMEIVRKMRALTQEELAQELDTTFAFMKYLKIPVAQQLSPIDMKQIDDTVGLTDEQRAEKWENDGYVAGRTALNRDQCPFDDPNSLAARHWFAGWDKGQAENAKGIKKTPAKKSSDAETGKLDGGVKEKASEKAEEKITPKHEPEVEAAKSKPAKKGVTYWHSAEKRKVYEVSTADADPEGAVSITKKEYEKLKADYEKADQEDWDAKAPADAGDDAGDDFGDEEPPSPDAA